MSLLVLFSGLADVQSQPPPNVLNEYGGASTAILAAMGADPAFGTVAGDEAEAGAVVGAHAGFGTVAGDSAAVGAVRGGRTTIQ